MSWVYFIQHGTAGAIKVGTTTGNPYARLRALQTGAPEPLRLLCAIPGDAALERELHERFQALRVRRDGEWFSPGPLLVAFIDGARAARAEQPEDEGAEPTVAGLSLSQIKAIAGVIGVPKLLEEAEFLSWAMAGHGSFGLSDAHELRNALQALVDDEDVAAGARFGAAEEIDPGGWIGPRDLDRVLREVTAHCAELESRVLHDEAEARAVRDQAEGMPTDVHTSHEVDGPSDLGPLSDGPPLNAQGGSA